MTMHFTNNFYLVILIMEFLSRQATYGIMQGTKSMKSNYKMKIRTQILFLYHNIILPVKVHPPQKGKEKETREWNHLGFGGWGGGLS